MTAATTVAQSASQSQKSRVTVTLSILTIFAYCLTVQMRNQNNVGSHGLFSSPRLPRMGVCWCLNEDIGL